MKDHLREAREHADQAMSHLLQATEAIGRARLDAEVQNELQRPLGEAKHHVNKVHDMLAWAQPPENMT